MTQDILYKPFAPDSMPEEDILLIIKISSETRNHIVIGKLRYLDDGSYSVLIDSGEDYFTNKDVELRDHSDYSWEYYAYLMSIPGERK